MQSAKLGREEKLTALQRLDDQARRLEHVTTGPSLEAVIATERERSHSYGGRSVFGWEISQIPRGGGPRRFLTSGQFFSHDRCALAQCHQLAERRRARKILHSAVRRRNEPLRIDEFQSRTDAAATTSGVSTFSSPRSITPSTMVLSRILQDAEIELGLCRLDGNLIGGAAGKLRQDE